MGTMKFRALHATINADSDEAVSAGVTAVMGQIKDALAPAPLDPIAILRARVADAGSQRAFATTHGVSAQHVSDVLRGRQAPGPKLLGIIGLQRVTTYQETPPCSTP